MSISSGWLWKFTVKLSELDYFSLVLKWVRKLVLEVLLLYDWKVTESVLKVKHVIYILYKFHHTTVIVWNPQISCEFVKLYSYLWITRMPLSKTTGRWFLKSQGVTRICEALYMNDQLFVKIRWSENIPYVYAYGISIHWDSESLCNMTSLRVIWHHYSCIHWTSRSSRFVLTFDLITKS